ncbi:MAG: ATP-binding cassette domain-containing protein [Solirubrobacteraceae bacterium]
MGALLSLQRVSLVFLRGGRLYTQVLDDVDLDVCAGEMVAVLAQHAEGKTTLVRVAAGIQRPDRGKVLFDGMEIWRLSDSRRSRLLASEIVFVEHGREPLDLLVKELVALPLLKVMGRRSAYTAASEALVRVGLHDCADQRWESLADCERALLTLARAVARRPRLLLVDDLMARLGLGAGDEVGRLLSELAREHGFGVLMSVPDAGSTSWCDRVATLSGGHLFVPAAQDNVVALSAQRRARS